MAEKLHHTLDAAVSAEVSATRPRNRVPFFHELTDCISENQGAIGVQCADGSAAFADVLLRVPRPITMAMSLG